MGYIDYIPYNSRTYDTQYVELLRKILWHGKKVGTTQETPAWRLIGEQMRFDLRNGIPITDMRDVVTGDRSILKQSLGELTAFLNGANTQLELESFGCYWWRDWLTPEKCAKRGLPGGNMGWGYGRIWRGFPNSDGSTFDQISSVLQQMRERPLLRTHIVTTVFPPSLYRINDQLQRVVVVPCHGSFHVFLDPDRGELELHHYQRSADAPVGLAANLIQYSALTLMLAHVLGYTATSLVYTISDAHIFVGQEESVEKLTSNYQPKKLPSLLLNTDIHGLFEFRSSDFTVEDYNPQHQKVRIWTPI